jgi:hypothetical protein
MSSAGNQLAAYFGDQQWDGLGSSIISMGNGKFAVFNPSDSYNDIAFAGSVMILSEATGAQLAVLRCDDADDNFGSGGFYVFPSGNFAIMSIQDDLNGIIDAGSLKVYKGSDYSFAYEVTGDVTEYYFGASLSPVGTNALAVFLPFSEINNVPGAGSVLVIHDL